MLNICLRSCCNCCCLAVCLVVKSCLTLCDPMEYSSPGAPVHEIFQARILECFAISSPGDLPNPGIKPASPALQADSLHTEPPGKLYIIDSKVPRNRLLLPNFTYICKLHWCSFSLFCCEIK